MKEFPAGKPKSTMALEATIFPRLGAKIEV
jgi:hypothetical protein